MTTNRTPIRRPALARITPAAIEAFRRLRTLELQCTCEWGREGDCPACCEWWQAQKIIHTELSLPVWHFPAVEYEGMAEWPPNKQARALWELFEQAAAAEPPRRRRKRAVESVEADAGVPNVAPTRAE